VKQRRARWRSVLITNHCMHADARCMATSALRLPLPHPPTLPIRPHRPHAQLLQGRPQVLLHGIKVLDLEALQAGSGLGQCGR